MRTLLVWVCLCTMAGAAQAQDTARLRGARGLSVAVIDAESREWQGRLLDVGGDGVVVELSQGTRRFDWTQIRRVDARSDKIWDGGLKGSLFGVVVGTLLFRQGRRAAAAGMTYGLIGIGLDAMHSCRHTVYNAPPVGTTSTRHHARVAAVISW